MYVFDRGPFRIIRRESPRKRACHTLLGSPDSGCPSPLAFLRVDFGNDESKPLAAILPIGSNNIDLPENIFESNAVYLMLKPPPLPKNRPIRLDGLTVDMRFVKHVAFYAWSPHDVSATLSLLATTCFGLETITIGFTRISGLNARQYQNMLWCGWDSMDSRSHITTLAPDLEAFAKLFENGLDEIESLDAEVLPEAEEVVFPLPDYDHIRKRVHPMERHFSGPNPPIIRVVEVPLLNSSPGEIRQALYEGAHSPMNSPEMDSQARASQSPLRTMDINLPVIHTTPNMHRAAPRAYTEDRRLRKENYAPDPTILADMPVQASFQPSSSASSGTMRPAADPENHKYEMSQEVKEGLGLIMNTAADLYFRRGNTSYHEL